MKPGWEVVLNTSTAGSYLLFFPMVSAGGRLMLKNAYLDIPIESVFRTDKNDIDSSIGFSTGYIFNF